MKDLIRFVKSSGVYFVGTVLTKLVTFLLLPLYTYYIPPAENGIYTLHLSYINFLCSVLFFEVWAGIMRFMFEYDSESRKKPITSGLVIFFMSSCLYTVVLAVAFPLMHIRYPALLYVFGLLMNMQTLIGYIARGYGKNVLYAACGLTGSIVTTCFNVILLVVCKMDYSALFIAGCIGYVVNIVVLLIGLRKERIFSGLSFDRSLFQEMLTFSLPLCLNSVAYWFVSGYNNYAVATALGDDANGFYSVAGRFGSMIVLFTSCFQMAWQELSYAKSAKSDDLGDFYTKATNAYIQFLGGGLVVLIPSIFIIYPIMVNASYGEGKALVPLYLLGTILSSISSFFGNIVSAIKKNNLLFVSMAIGSVTNIIAIQLLLPVLGLQASNIALSLGFLFVCISRVVMLRAHMNLRVDVKNIGGLLLAGLVVGAVYMHGDLVSNGIAFVAAFLFVLILFREYIQVIGKKLLSRTIFRGMDR